MQIRHKSFQKKYTEIRERISEVFVTDILRGKFEAISNIGRAVRADQGIHVNITGTFTPLVRIEETIVPD